MLTPAEARRQGRRARRCLSPARRREASDTICRRIARTAWFRNARTVVAYAPTDEEVDILPLARHAARLGKDVWLPVISGAGTLGLQRWHAASPLRANRYGILEPFAPERANVSVQWRTRTVVCAPVVAFDAQLNRVGMGGGYYDRLFATTAHLAAVMRLGVAFDCQRARAIDAAAWDMPLDVVVTEASTRHRRRSPAAAQC